MTEYARRRKLLMQMIGPKALVILPAAKEILRNGDALYPFRQNSDFYYLTGFGEPDSFLILAPKRNEGEFILFNRPRDPASEIWDGPRVGQQGARKLFLADQSFSIAEFNTLLPELLLGRETVYFPIGVDLTFDEMLMDCINHLRKKIRSGLQAPLAFIDSAPLIHEMRLLKGKEELAILRKAIDITGLAHIKAMQICQPGMYEYELEAELMHVFQKNGARFPAYGSIVGSGANTCILHYVNNNKQIKNGELVLIDAGAEYENYAADITRTFPANGRFSTEQRLIYELVLAAQLAAIQSIKPGVSWNRLQDIIVKKITQGLIDLGILKGKLEDLIEKKSYFPFYMHRSGHWLGLDVHDAGQYILNGKWRHLQPGMVLTVEPGIYIAKSIPGVHKRWHNIGVRIEDDVLVTSDGFEVLSKAIPKTIEEIETTMAQGTAERRNQCNDKIKQKRKVSKEV